MTVKELIKELEEMPQDMQVMINLCSDLSEGRESNYENHWGEPVYVTNIYGEGLETGPEDSIIIEGMLTGPPLL